MVHHVDLMDKVQSIGHEVMHPHHEHVALVESPPF